ncbi:molecular chaperone DnaJ [Corynebacterium yudongzhengii]|uniref:Chaperone protein DnaJ n=1 Tax=Corynebacterium yudongzhengii TaxID=2080740 RepID=A0A2U1T4N2_9CORY|nr:molecular chaperone DnaJ [Corynebacterium yudongzhengii]AWB82716.1 molecular chaperone DnaJ [Corynebacterium yudongzhengii]PWC00959.1 molecular chaperone DnaJ [Corynebacterium yudongzhengii]
MNAPSEWADKDFYADLGVSSSASAEEIKKAYRKLARENHPDANPGDDAAEARFKKAAAAYDVLGDEKKRKEYDQLKAMLRNGGFPGFGGNGGAGSAGGFRSQGPTSGFDFSDVFSRTGGGFSEEGGLGDIFGSFFDRGRGTGRAARPTRGADVETEITLDFREAAKGTTIPVELSGNAPCTTCHGSGSRSGKPSTCSKCSGTGFVSEQRGAFGMSQPCDECGATGKKVTDPCSACKGTGTQYRKRSITVRIPAGVIDGQKVRLAGQGEAGPNGTPSGDLFVSVTVRPDKVFTRSGDDLEVTVPVSFAELALGDTITVPTLDSPVKVRVPAGTPDGRTLRVRGRGIPKRGGKAGDLLVTVRVTVPSSLDDAAKSALRTYAQAERDSGFDPRAGWAGRS